MTSRSAASSLYVTAASGGGSGAGASIASPPVVVTGDVVVQDGGGARMSADVTTNGYPTGVFWRYTSASDAGVTGTIVVPASTVFSTVTFDVTGLDLSTDYKVRAFAFHMDGPFTSQTVVGELVFFTTGGAGSVPPTCVTRPATLLGATAATLHGDVDPNGTPTSAWFEYTGPGGTVSTDPVDVAAAGSVAVSLTDLVEGTDYTFRCVAENTDGQRTNGNLLPFTTGTTHDVPVVGSLVVSALAATTALGTVTFDTGGLACHVRIDVGTDTGYGMEFHADVTAAESTVAIPIVGLTASTGYHARAVVLNSLGVSVTPDQTFTTLSAGSFPTGDTGLPTSIVTNGAVLNALVNPGGAATTVEFSLWRSDAPGFVTRWPSAQTNSGSSDVGYATRALNLQPYVAYTYVMVATNANGVVTGREVEFKTAGGAGGLAAVVTTTTPATNVTDTSMTVAGTIADGLVPATSYFEYWVTGQPVRHTPARFADYGLTGFTGTRTVAEQIDALAASTTYNFRLCVVTAADAAVQYGPTRTGTTNAGPAGPAATSKVTFVSAASSTVLRCDGEVNPKGEATDCRFQASLTAAFTSIAGESAIETTGATTGVQALTQADIAGLTAGTAYYVRVKTVHSVGPVTSYSATFGPVSTSSVVPPSVGTTVLSGATPTTMQATATVTVPTPVGGGDVFVWFEYGTASGVYDVVTLEQNIGQVAGAYPITIQMSPLVPSTDYYCRCGARNAIGQVVYGAEGGPEGTPGGGSSSDPVVKATGLKNVTPHHFEMVGSVQTNGSATDITFQYVLASDGDWDGAGVVSRPTQTIADTAQVWLVADHSEYVATDAYLWRIKAVNSTAVPIHAYPLAAQVVCPVAVPDPAFAPAIVQHQTGQNLTFLDAESVRLRFYCKHNGQRMWMQMEWGTDPTLATYTRSRWVSYWGPDRQHLALNAGAQGEMRYADYLTGLAENTTYYFRLRCWSVEGEHTSAIGFITTKLSGAGPADHYCATWLDSVGSYGTASADRRVQRNMMGPVPANLRLGSGTRTTTQEVVWQDASPTIDYTAAEKEYTILVTPTQISTPATLAWFTTKTQTDSTSTPNLAYALRVARVGDKIRMDGSHRMIAGRFTLKNFTNPLLSGMQGSIIAGNAVGNDATGSVWQGVVVNIINSADDPQTQQHETNKAAFQIRITSGTAPTSGATTTPGGDPTFPNIYKIGAPQNFLQGVKLYYSGTYLYQGCEIGGDASGSTHTTPANSIAYWKGTVSSAEKRYPITGVRVMALASAEPWGLTGLTFGNGDGGFNGLFFKDVYVDNVTTDNGPTIIVAGQAGGGGGGVWGVSDGVFKASDPTSYGGWGVKWHVRSQSPTTMDIRRCTFSPSNEHATYRDSDGEINPSDSFLIDCHHTGTSPDGLKTYSQRAFFQTDARGDLSQNNATGPGFPPGRGTFYIKNCSGRAGNSAGCVSFWGRFGDINIDGFVHHPIPQSEGGGTNQAFVIQDNDSEKGMWLNEHGYPVGVVTITNYSTDLAVCNDVYAKFRGVENLTIDSFSFLVVPNKVLFTLWESGRFDNGYVRFTGAGTAPDALWSGYEASALGAEGWPGSGFAGPTAKSKRIQWKVNGLSQSVFQELQDGKQFTVIN